MVNKFVTPRKQVMIISHRRGYGLELADRLASEGYEVALVRQADEAAEPLTAMNPDRIILDRHLPIAYGLEALRLIRLQCPRVPVFTMTGSASWINGELPDGAGHSPFCLTPLQGTVMGTLLDAHVRS